ncbi:MAG: hypothetical protein WBL87_08520 [Methanothrix sp.]
MVRPLRWMSERRVPATAGYERCSSCAGLEGCTRFDWLREHGQEEYIWKMRSSY